MASFRGCWRRFEIVKKTPPIVSDYGHHPTEIKATLKAAREKWPDKEIWCVYQPHQYQRTHYLFKDFVKVLREAPSDKIIVTDIYDVAGREEKKIKETTNAIKLVEKTNKKSVVYLPQKKLAGYLRKKLLPKRVLIIMGAGDIYRLVDKIS